MYYNKLFFTTILLLVFTNTFAQFHTLKTPQLSNRVIESQRLGVTDITVNYGSPSVNKRDVWNDINVIPQKGNPIPWRAGANMNTTIEFTTDVFIEGQLLKAGVYGFHIIPRDNMYTLLFAHNHNQWGSYYLDIEKDITLQVEVSSVTCSYSEKLDYEFLDWKENSVTIGLEWGDRRIPFTVSVDLNKTVVESFRSELRGINTYHWQAWNDAASWCLSHDTNIEEAFEWVERSINGGYGGFAANKNFTNLSTKLRFLSKLNKMQMYDEILEELLVIDFIPEEGHRFGRSLLSEQKYQEALKFTQMVNKKYPDVWFLIINEGLAKYFLNDVKRAVKDINRAISLAPEQLHPRLKEVINQMNAGTYSIPF